jgi:pyridoxine 5-phosphate synthase
VKLGVNIDHVATVRQARRGAEPDPVLAASLAELGGADSIVCHLREDRRHVQDRDLELLRKTVKTRLNLEMGLAPEIIEIAIATKPDQVTLVPERRQELTTEGGLDVVGAFKRVADAVKRFRKAGINVSLFIDPDSKQIDASLKSGATIVELHTGEYANRATPAELAKLAEASKHAAGRRLFVAAGHGLNYQNVTAVAAIPEIEELNIGHSIVARALATGLEAAVRTMKSLMLDAR